MPKFRVTQFEEAERNIDAIYQWIAERSPEGAIRWFGALMRKLGELADDAERFPLAPESQLFDTAIRDASFSTRGGHRYRILFTIDGDDVSVLFVRAPGQDRVTRSDD
ncbi:MAG: type II toxin-antitoxin system RelE/ParE family toxin [Pirellulales bacterium]